MSDNIVQLGERRRLRKAIEHYGGMANDPRFIRLAEMAEEQRKAILADPLPHLQRMATLVSKLRQAIEEADHYLAGHGEMNFREPEDPPRPPKPLTQLYMERVARAREVLGTALEER